MTEQQPAADETPEQVPHRKIMPGSVWRVPDMEDPALSRDLYRGAAWTVPIIGDDENGPEGAAP